MRIITAVLLLLLLTAAIKDVAAVALRGSTVSYPTIRSANAFPALTRLTSTPMSRTRTKSTDLAPLTEESEDDVFEQEIKPRWLESIRSANRTHNKMRTPICRGSTLTSIDE
eukprot:Lankesteria_metandrocarpae@DN9628_c0_g1_i1.p1